MPLYRESKVECNQKMKLPQGLNNLHGRINHLAAEKKATKSLLFLSLTKELFQPRSRHLRAWVTNSPISYPKTILNDIWVLAWLNKCLSENKAPFKEQSKI